MRLTTGKTYQKRHQPKPLGVMAIRRNEKVAADLIRLAEKMEHWKLIPHLFQPVFSTCEHCGEPADARNQYGKKIHL